MYNSEFKGDEYIPSLNGISRLKKFDVFSDLKIFNYSHKYAKPANLTETDLEHLKDYFITETDINMKKSNRNKITLR